MTQSSNGDNLQEGLIERRQMVSFEMDDKSLISVADSWIAEAKTLHDTFKRKQDKNEDYFLGNQLDDKKMSKYKARIVLNKIWQSLETVIPRATKKLPAPMVSLPAQEDPAKEVDFRKYTDELEDIILSLAMSLNLPVKLKEFLRFSQLFYLGVLKYGYDEREGIWVENIRPQRILVPPYLPYDYVIEYHENSIKELIRLFPGKKEEIKKMFFSSGNSGINIGTRVGYYEVTIPEFKFWKVNELLLDKVANPHFDFKEGKNNHWKNPEIDYIFSDLWQLGKNVYSQTTLVDQVISLQDGINKRKRQISDNADKANGILVGYGTGDVTKKEVAAIEAARERPDGAVWLRDAAQGSVQHFSGQLLQPYVFEDMQHTINEIDNIFGTHSTTRGEKTPGEETFGGRQLLKESDQERIDELTQMLERVTEKLYNAFAQMIKIHFTKDEYIAQLGEDGTSVQLKIQKDVVKEGVSIKVRQGSTLTKDKATLSAEAIQLWQFKAIDPVTLFERIGDPHPYKTAERLYLWTVQPEILFKKVSAELKDITKSDRQEEVLNAISQAEIENRAIMQGMNVPPYEGANEQHMAAHQDYFGSEEFMSLPKEIRLKAAMHLESELKIIKGGLEKRKEKEGGGMNIKEMLDMRSGK